MVDHLSYVLQQCLLGLRQPYVCWNDRVKQTLGEGTSTIMLKQKNCSLSADASP